MFHYNDNSVLMKVPGRIVRQACENAVSMVPGKHGRFASIAGFKFSWDSEKPAGQRVIDLSMPDGSPLDEDKEFTLCTFGFMAEGGDGFTCFNDESVTWITNKK